MIAQLVFDLPLEGFFDYLIPESLIPLVKIGMRAKVFFGPRRQIGFIVGLLEQSNIPKLKSLDTLLDEKPIFNEYDLKFAREFSAYYGCSLGESLATLLRNKKDMRPSLRREHKPSLSLHRCLPQEYAFQIQKIMAGYQKDFNDAKGRYCQFLILVPDSFHAQALSRELKGGGFTIGTRSAVFDCDGRFDAVVMVDNQDASFLQEQTPMYDTTQVLLRRSEIFGFDVSFVGVSPSVELMALVAEGQIKFIDEKNNLSFKVVDLTNYKFIPGMISPPVRDAVEAALRTKKKSILILNRRGSYRLTRCVDCGEILKCQHCDSPLTFSRLAKKYTCPHCTFSLAGDTNCPKCRKPSWRSLGMGVEQLQTEIKKIFPLAKVLTFEREAKASAKQSNVLGDFDILISTQAVLRFQGQFKAAVAAFIDFDSELNRLQMRSSFNAMSLCLQVASMADLCFIQARNINHYVLNNLSRGHLQEFYDEELKLRKELGFSPFKHWIKITWRSKTEKIVSQAAEDVYNKLIKLSFKSMVLTAPQADGLLRKRDSFRLNVMVHTDKVEESMALIKSVLAQTKRRGKFLVTLQVDP